MTQKSLQDAVGPTGMSDAVATMLGLKSYSHGTTYNGGNAPTISGIAGLDAVGTANNLRGGRFIPYQMQDGSWRLKISVMIDFTSVTTPTFAIAGIVFLGSTAGVGIWNYQQLYAAPVAGITDVGYVIANGTLNTITMQTATAIANLSLAGDVALASKPTWAY